MSASTTDARSRTGSLSGKRRMGETENRGEEPVRKACPTTQRRTTCGRTLRSGVWREAGLSRSDFRSAWQVVPQRSGKHLEEDIFLGYLWGYWKRRWCPTREDDVEHEQHYGKSQQGLCPPIGILGEQATIGTDDPLCCDEFPLFPSPENSDCAFLVGLWDTSVRESGFLPGRLSVARGVYLVTPYWRPPEGNDYKNEPTNP